MGVIARSLARFKAMPGAQKRTQPRDTSKSGCSRPRGWRLAARWSLLHFHLLKLPGKKEKIRSVVKSIPCKTNKGTSNIFISENGSKIMAC